MARRVIEEVLDDFDPETPATDKITFSFDGTTYEIDLSEENATTFRSVMNEYIEVAREVKPEAPRRTRAASNGSKPARAAKPAADPGKDVSAIRAWASENGFAVNARGRISRHILDEYDKAHA